MAQFPATRSENTSTARPLAMCLVLAASLACGKLAAQPAKAPQPEPLQITVSGPKEAVVDRPLELQVHVFNSGGKASDKAELVIGHFSQKTKRLAAARGLEEETVTVLVAKRNLSTGTIINKPEESFEQKEILKETVPKNVLSKFEEVKGRQLKIPRRQGDTISLDDLADPPSIMMTLPPGHRAVGLRVSSQQIADGFAAVPHSRVDIALTVRDDDAKTVTSKIILEDVLVLASESRAIRDDAGKTMFADFVTLALTPEDALKLETARAKGSISLLLRPFGEPKRGKVDDKKNDAGLNGLQAVPHSRVDIVVPVGDGDNKNDTKRLLAAVLTLASGEQKTMTVGEKIRLPLPALAAKERRTVKLTVTPRRIGSFTVELGIDRTMPSPEPIAIAATVVVEIKFDSKTPAQQFLPAPPKVDAAAKPRLPRSLAEVPEVSFEEPLAKTVKAEAALDRTAHMIDKISHMNGQKQDAFMEELLSKRSDLAGLSFAMADACRLREEPSQQFALALVHLRRARARTFTNVANTLANVGGSKVPDDPSPTQVTSREADEMMQRFRGFCEEADAKQRPIDAEHAVAARIAAVMQVMTPESPQMRLGLVKYLAGVSHAEATRALAKLALFSEEEEVRRAALEALKTRREKDYSGVLLQGLSYPWPAVARRSSECIVKLERHDLIPQLLDVLDLPDPRAPQSDGKKTTVVRELVRINHHRNCLLCHAPAHSDGPAVAVDLAAEIPMPNQPLPGPSSGSGYGTSTVIPEHAVRVDVTYLRQDFSVKLPVAGAHPWPEMQRFDFVVRTREVSDEQAQAYRELLQPRETGVLSPYHQAALFALRELTGRDTEPTAAAWRKLLAPANR